jgi:hypothetical protein
MATGGPADASDDATGGEAARQADGKRATELARSEGLEPPRSVILTGVFWPCGAKKTRTRDSLLANRRIILRQKL